MLSSHSRERPGSSFRFFCLSQQPPEALTSLHESPEEGGPEAHHHRSPGCRKDFPPPPICAQDIL
ncbi:unnamed protein product [Gulo gulo]|uniref:Uncharacterized protein n=1 Tax=Gulo gulo TaxID=48420 RepID=A0A9X9Q103_GULGU|nr:unnamed protein product [Gulo gulo]